MAERDEAAVDAARKEMADAISVYARVSGYTDDDHIITTFVVATAEESIVGGRDAPIGVITSHPMPRWQIHGLLSDVDATIVSGDIYTDEDYSEDL